MGDEQEKSLTVARSHAEQFAHDLRGWLLFCGGYGSGKTHLAAAIANHAAGLGISTLLLTVPDLLDTLRASYSSDDDPYAARFEEIRNVQLLVLDNLWTQNATSWAQEKLFQLFDHRYVKKLPTVVTTDMDLEELDGRIRSRLQDPELVTVLKINAPDYRQPVQQGNQPRRSVLSLLHACTFGNFSLRELEKLNSEELKSLTQCLPEGTGICRTTGAAGWSLWDPTAAAKPTWRRPSGITGLRRVSRWITGSFLIYWIICGRHSTRAAM